ncbi:ATP-dependent DNA ligase [Streptomyces musisoli]|uniref:ATP-dependent DNA ligase n=1 Tax=Streptomyces musisoli TaxID=2802280 RepID=UPI001F17CB8F|nr:hypothetical protein [Streptomyces musisoli]
MTDPALTAGFPVTCLRDSGNPCASVFDVLEADGLELLDRPYRERRALLERLLADGVLVAPITLYPATPDRAIAEDWLDPAWGVAGIEGVLVKGNAQPCSLGRRGWIKVRARLRR